MARLNEPTVSSENFESLKRKFIRQNRDIARVNSTQSLRIRELENETSNLLAENLSLREEILHLQCDQESKQFRLLGEQTIRLKAQLESKLLEISTLVSEFGHDVPKQDTPKHERKKIIMDLLESPGEKYKNINRVNDALASPDQRLPPITEDTNYEQHTSGDHDVLNLIASTDLFSTESPDIGSPPTSQFVDADPVKINLPKKTDEGLVEKPVRLDPTLSITVEHRRKKKDSLGSADFKRSNHTEITPGLQETDTGTDFGLQETNAESLKSGAKRKLCLREEEDVEEREAIVSKDTKAESGDVESNQSVHGESEATASTDIITKKNIDPPTTRGSRDKQNISNRKALAPKNVNMSPNKIPSSCKGEKPVQNSMQKKVSVREKVREKTSHKDITLRPTETVMIEKIDLLDESDFQTKPKTPGSMNRTLNITSQSSKLQAKSEDTPPPSDVGPRTDGGRPSRRVRGSVSYTEPNLRHKMRRPTQEFADAVTRDRSNSARRIGRLEENIENGVSSTTLKNQDESNDNSMRGSTDPCQLSGCLTTNRKRRESLIGVDQVVAKTERIARGRDSFLNENEQDGHDDCESTLTGPDSDAIPILEGLSRRRRRSTLSVHKETPTSNFDARRGWGNKDMRSSSPVNTPEMGVVLPSRPSLMT